MVGAYKLSVRVKGLSYDLVLKSQVTVVKGNTATGKSYFVDLVEQYVREKGSCRSTIKVVSDFTDIGVVSNPKELDYVLKGMSGGLIIMDEIIVAYLYTQIPSIVLNSGNYFLLFTRLPLNRLPYSIVDVREFDSNIVIENEKSFTEVKFLPHIFQEKIKEY